MIAKPTTRAEALGNAINAAENAQRACNVLRHLEGRPLAWAATARAWAAVAALMPEDQVDYGYDPHVITMDRSTYEVMKAIVVRAIASQGEDYVIMNQVVNALSNKVLTFTQDGFTGAWTVTTRDNVD